MTRSGGCLQLPLAVQKRAKSVSDLRRQGIPTVTNEYDGETGTLEKLSTSVEGKTKTLTSKYNTLGQLVSYTDAAAKASTAATNMTSMAACTKPTMGKVRRHTLTA